MLRATDFQPNQLQIFNLLTGVMPDQPVTLSNTVSVGGDQRAGAAALRVYGPLEVYRSRADAQPAFVLGGEWSVAELQAEQLALRAEVQSVREQLLAAPWRRLRPGVVTSHDRVVVGDSDPWSAKLAHGQAALVVRADDLGAGGVVSAVSVQCWSGSWLQCNVRFVDEAPGTGWQGKRLCLDFDVDNAAPGTAGRISMRNGKVAIGGIGDVEAAFAHLEERMRTLSINVALLGRQQRERR